MDGWAGWGKWTGGKMVDNSTVWVVIFSACEGEGMAFLVERMGCELAGVLVRGTAAAVFSFEGIRAIGGTEVRLVSGSLELRQLW